MTEPQPVMNPFILMTHPQDVFAAMERSERLSRLQSRICRPLDKPLIGTVGADLAAFDQAVDAAAEVSE